MFQTTEEIFRASHGLPLIRVRVVKRPIRRAFVFAGVAGVLVSLAAFAVF